MWRSLSHPKRPTLQLSLDRVGQGTVCGEGTYIKHTSAGTEDIFWQVNRLRAVDTYMYLTTNYMYLRGPVVIGKRLQCLAVAVFITVKAMTEGATGSIKGTW